MRELLEAELSRRLTAIEPGDLAARSVEVRRAAARALARIGAPESRELLLRALADEDPRVVAWAAYGLGMVCAEGREPIVRALVATESSHRLRAPSIEDVVPSPLAAIARAIGRCAAPSSEATLVEWARAGGPTAPHALRALGDLVDGRRRLREDSYVALLELAAGSATARPFALALYPISRASHLPPSVIERAREVATARLDDSGPDRVLAIRALGRTDGRAAAVLEPIVLDPNAPQIERAEAAKALARLGRDGQKALGRAIAAMASLVAEPGQAASFVATSFGAVITALESLTALGDARRHVERFAEMQPPEDAPSPLLRRFSLVRCAAAELLAERRFDHPLLTGCDLATPWSGEGEPPPGGSIGARALVSAIGVDGVKIRGKRHREWLRYATGADARARQAALALIADHPEIEGVRDVLLAALRSPHAGVVAAAARQIALHPERVREDAADSGKPAALSGIEEALIELLGGEGPAADLEALAAVIDAAVALRLAAAKDRLQALCGAAHPLRDKLAHALARIAPGGAPLAPCLDPDRPAPLPAELGHLHDGAVTVRFESDAGELVLELDPTLAPVAVTRVLDLVRAGFYDGMVVHRAVPGFVAQLGSLGGDGFGPVADKPPIPSETAPIAFDEGAVGLASALRDTGTTQIFVTRAAYPHLDGAHPLLGRASGPWAELVEGDILHRATIVGPSEAAK